MKYYLLSFLFCCLLGYADAQKVDLPLKEKEWFVQNFGADLLPADIVYISATEALAPVKIGKKEYGVVKINAEGKEFWKTPVPGLIVGLGKAEDKVTVVYSLDKSKNLILMAVSLNATTGKIISEEAIYENKEDRIYRFKGENHPGGILNHILIRKTANSANGWVSRSNLGKTTECVLITFDESGKKKNTIQLNIPEDSYFLGSVLDKHNELYVGYHQQNTLVVERYNSSFKQVQKLQTELPVQKIGELIPLLYADPIDQKIWLTATYVNEGKDKAHQTFCFDFNSKKVLASGDEELDKSFRSSIEMKEVEGVKNANLKMIPFLKPVGLFTTEDKVIVLEQADYLDAHGTKGATRYATNGLYVSFYNRNLKKIKTIGLNKWYECFVDVGTSLGYNYKESKLYIATPANGKGIGSNVNLFCVVDIKTENFENVIKLDNGSLTNSIPVEGNATFWFKDGCLISYIIPVGGAFSSKSYNIALQKVTW
jgi:hypothetical protein